MNATATPCGSEVDAFAAAADCPKLVSDPTGMEDQLAVFCTAEEVLRRKPFTDATSKK